MSNLLSLREKTNLTQEELAEKSEISVRTIQRLEAGAVPKGHTLKALASSLGVGEEQLMGSPPKELEENRTLWKILNLSSLPGTFFPPANIVLPLLIMFLRKRFDPLAKQLLTVQILWTVLAFIIFMTSAMMKNWFDLGNKFMLIIMALLILSNMLIIFLNASEIDRHGRLRIKLKFSLI